MNIKKIIKKQTSIVALAIVIVSIAVMGVSYAIFFDVKTNTKNQIITAGTLKLTASATQLDIEGSKLVMIDEDGIKSTQITYSIKHEEKSTLPATYSIYLSITSSNPDTKVLNYLKYSLDGQTTFNINTINPENINGVECYEIATGGLNPGEQEDSKDLRLWLDENMINHDIIETLTINLYIVSEVTEN